jgi:hypothetical protein
MTGFISMHVRKLSMDGSFLIVHSDQKDKLKTSYLKVFP